MSYESEQRISRAVREAAELLKRRDDEPRADRAWFAADAAKRYSLSPELAAKITATRPAEIMRQAQDLSLTRASIAAAETEAETPAVKRAPVAGSYSPLHDDDGGFNAEDTARRIRNRY